MYIENAEMETEYSIIEQTLMSQVQMSVVGMRDHYVNESKILKQRVVQLQEENEKIQMSLQGMRDHFANENSNLKQRVVQLQNEKEQMLKEKNQKKNYPTRISFNTKEEFSMGEKLFVRQLVYSNKKLAEMREEGDYDCICVLKPIHINDEGTTHFNVYLNNHSQKKRSPTIHCYIDEDRISKVTILKEEEKKRIIQSW